jgi:hypothetical protein
MLTPYQFAHNSPIVAIDLDGLEAEATNKEAQESFASKVEEVGLDLKEKAEEALKGLFPGKENIIDSFSDAFDQVLENTKVGDFDAEASLKVSTGLRYSNTTKIKTGINFIDKKKLPAFILGKSIEFNLGSIVLAEIKKTASVNIFDLSSFKEDPTEFNHIGNGNSNFMDVFQGVGAGVTLLGDFELTREATMHVSGDITSQKTILQTGGLEVIVNNKTG